MYQNWVRQDNVDKENWCWVLIVSRTNCQGWAGWWDAVRHSDGWNWWHRCHPPVTVIRNFLPLLPPTPQAWAIWFWFVLFNSYNQETLLHPTKAIIWTPSACILYRRYCESKKGQVCLTLGWISVVFAWCLLCFTSWCFIVRIKIYYQFSLFKH